MATNAEQVAQLRWKKFPVLDDGFVCLVDIMGDDQSVVQAARVSYGEGTRKVSDDRGLIRYLLRHRHTTPFEMAEVKFLVRVPMDCWRQWIRHRTANVNEYSTRYSLAIDAMQTTHSDAWRTQATQNRQGSGEFLDLHTGESLSAAEAEFQRTARELYQQRIASGVAREQARKDLPLATYTEAYWKVDLHNLLHFLALRMDDHAQAEIRAYATAIGEQIVRPLFPLVWEAFVDYRLEGVFLSRLEREVIVRLVERLAAAGRAQATDEDFLAAQDPTWAKLQRCRERDECREKLRLLNLLKNEENPRVP
jgi:thymidylate synthase (FAD)